MTESKLSEIFFTNQQGFTELAMLNPRNVNLPFLYGFILCHIIKFHIFGDSAKTITYRASYYILPYM